MNENFQQNSRPGKPSDLSMNKNRKKRKARKAAAFAYVIPIYGIDPKFTSFTVDRDGSFSFSMIAERAIDTGDGNEIGGQAEVTLSGTFKAIEKADGQVVLKIVNVSHDHSLGYQRTKEAGMEVYEVEDDDFHNGIEFIFYPAGTSWTDLDSRAQESLKGDLRVTEGLPVSGPVLYIEGTTRAFMG